MFILDADVLIQAHRSTYPLDVAVSFWNKIKKLAIDKKIISIDKVRDQIYKNEDQLKRWIGNNLPLEFFKNTEDQNVLTQYREVVQWANRRHDHYHPKAITEFLERDNADAWLIAFALVSSSTYTIVTQEISAPHSKSKIKIPDVCNAFNITWINTVEMFRRLNETF